MEKIIASEVVRRVLKQEAESYRMRISEG